MRKLKGVVVSDKMDKAVVVRIDTSKTHPIYKKSYVRSSRIGVTDPKNEIKVGDLVEIVETVPVSKTIHFKVGAVLGRAEEVVKQIEEQDELKAKQELIESMREEARAAREAERTKDVPAETASAETKEEETK